VGPSGPCAGSLRSPALFFPLLLLPPLGFFLFLGVLLHPLLRKVCQRVWLWFLVVVLWFIFWFYCIFCLTLWVFCGIVVVSELADI